MRVDDNMVYGQGCGGLYESGATKGTILLDFLVFCKLAVENHVVPPGWDWPAFLRVAAGLLIYAFEKSDAKDKWGGENVFSVMFGGRSLRVTAEAVYGNGVQSPSCPARRAMYRKLGRDWDALVTRPATAAAVFEDVGGLPAWLQLQSNMPHPEQMIMM